MSVKRVAVVTGGTRGIGKATAALLRKRGFAVHALGRKDFDLTDEDALAAYFRALGRVDVLVNNAGAAHVAPPLSIGASDFDTVLRVNVTGTYLCAKAVLPGMLKRRWGRVINVSSIAGRSFSRTASAAYTSSKAAVIGLTRHLASVVGPGVTVNCVCPSQTRTDMLLANTTPAQRKALGRLAEPEEVAEAIAFLASEGATYVNGAVLDVNGGGKL